MSELINARRRNENLRRNLLTNVSMLALLGYLGASQGAAVAADEDTPTVWIELGGQLERVDSAQKILSPAFFAHANSIDRSVMTDAQAAPPYSIGGEGKITFAPKASDWVFSAGIRYGRSNSVQHLHHQVPITISHSTFYALPFFPPGSNYIHPSHDIQGDAQTRSDSSHVVVDFQAGKDVGLGLFGNGGKSIVSAGVRYAQFASSSDATLHARPINRYEFVTHPGKYRFFNIYRHTYTAVFHADRGTHAVGPSLSWDASLPVAGRGSDMMVNFDWGANAAVLFGRQRAQVHHQTTGNVYSRTGGLAFIPHTYHYVHPADHDRVRSVTIPNVGGFAGVSFRYADAKVSFGYRGDFFFGAMDGGIDAVHRENIGFYGPFATISVGLGG